LCTPEEPPPPPPPTEENQINRNKNRRRRTKKTNLTKNPTKNHPAFLEEFVFDPEGVILDRAFTFAQNGSTTG